MLVINYNGNKPTTDYFKYSVQGNNKADTIRFLVSLSQDGLVFDENYHYYAKVQSEIDNFYDKVELSEIEFDDSENLLKADFILESKHTNHEKIEVALCCENLDSEIVWQTQLVKVAISNGINADGEIASQYPTVLEQLQEQIDELKQGGGAGFKTILLEVMPSIIGEIKPLCYRHLLRLNLINFTSDDVGSYIYLYNKSIRKKTKTKYIQQGRIRATRRMAYKHPNNWNNDTITNIAKLGFGCLANIPFKHEGDEYTVQDVPSFMKHNGFVQTEYEITQEHIEQGYMEIDYGIEFLSLLMPNPNDGDNYEDGYFVFNRQVKLFGDIQFITYYQVKQGKITAFPVNQIYLSIDGEPSLDQVVTGDDSGQDRLRQYFTIKILPY